jgi:hypothetical protein
MKKLGRDGTLYAVMMMDWHNAFALWHVECGTGRELQVYFITGGEEGIGIPASCVDGRILQAGKKKPGSKTR